jgi:PLP dependent protein
MASSFIKGSIADRLSQIRQSIPDSVRLIAVSKQVSVEAMRTAYAAGVRDFGESKIQEAAIKQAQLQDLPDITWHLIGHLQSNKALKALELFQWIHSIDSLQLAQRLDHLAENLHSKPNICLQIKIFSDPNKFGWTVPELLNDLPQLDRCQHLNIVGLMAIPPYNLEPDQTRTIFLQTRELAEKIQQQPWSNLQISQLSMGMSEDYSLAIAAGSTMIRLGRVLFGERDTPPQPH